MTFSIAPSRDGAVTVALIGELDVATSCEFRDALDVVVASRAQLVELDLSQLRLIDSVGIGLLVAFYKRTRDQGGEVVLREAGGQPLALFRLVQLDRLMMGTVPSRGEMPVE
jgi:anti-sigma B factor antagonist